MAGWYDLVLRLDSCQVYSGGYSGGGEQRSYQNTGRGSSQLDEPMDINAMAPKERQCHPELGLCFYCHKQGHLFSQCPERDKKRKENPKRRQPSGPAYVRGLFKDLPIEDRAALFKQLQGFLKGSENSTHSDQRPYALHISHVVTGIMQLKALYTPLTVRGVHKDVDIEALIDSGAMATYIHPRLMIKLRLSTTPLARPIPVFNGMTKVIKAYVAGIGQQDIILGHEWLQKENPVIDWKSGQMKFNDHKRWMRFEQNESLI
ncbi:hypothetical protein DAEQUDRAFT_770223 [Daedalea quercina L-15889]|uniref:CCHC-type domain-containing protein n=1 Tax=Daedalea quercina L-15889 TaxID=1314783 RepID=A0A165L0X7_9APHY|nr:hypothetical protein DAEQUDRAFT_770223 [Daedalea quercina L-15889]